MNDKYRVIIASDPEHEKVFAEIQYGNKFLALVSQEDGPDHLKVELPGIGLDESHVIRQANFDEFLWVLEVAAKRLLGE